MSFNILITCDPLEGRRDGAFCGYNTVIDVLDESGKRLHRTVQVTDDIPSELEASKLLIHYLVLLQELAIKRIEELQERIRSGI